MMSNLRAKCFLYGDMYDNGVRLSIFIKYEKQVLLW